MDLGIGGRTALVTGGSAGLGYATAAALAREGARIVLNARNGGRLAEAAARLRSDTAAEIHEAAADVSRREEALDLVRRAEAAAGPVDILFCNAGGPPAGAFLEHDEDAWDDALDANLLSAVHLARAAVPGMRARHWGRIICVGSIAAKEPQPGLILSTTARAGLLGFARSLADEVAVDGITVNVLCPGLIATDRLRSLAAARAVAGTTVEEQMERQAAAIPVRRVGRPDEFGAVAAFLASDLASYITGTALSVDGGLHRSIL